MPGGDRNGARAQAVVLGAAIRELRESLGWSQSRLATELCKVSNTVRAGPAVNAQHIVSQLAALRDPLSAPSRGEGS